MIKLEHVVLASPEQMEFIIEGMRNPKNSWEKSDSEMLYGDPYCAPEDFKVGENDNSLMQRLSKAGTDHRKFMRMMPVYVRITAPLYWWKEFDTYKVGTIANSCSTMHKIQEKEFTLEDFSCEHLGPPSIANLKNIIKCMNDYREEFIKDSEKHNWWQMIQLLPSSYNQTRNVMMNYEVLANIYKSRKNHKLDEWRELCAWIESLPYAELITCASGAEDDKVSVTRCKDCQLYVPEEEMTKDSHYDGYNNDLGHDGICEGTDTWTHKKDYCSCAIKKNK